MGKCFGWFRKGKSKSDAEDTRQSPWKKAPATREELEENGEILKMNAMGLVGLQLQDDDSQQATMGSPLPATSSLGALHGTAKGESSGGVAADRAGAGGGGRGVGGGHAIASPSDKSNPSSFQEEGGVIVQGMHPTKHLAKTLRDPIKPSGSFKSSNSSGTGGGGGARAGAGAGAGGGEKGLMGGSMLNEEGSLQSAARESKDDSKPMLMVGLRPNTDNLGRGVAKGTHQGSGDSFRKETPSNRPDSVGTSNGKPTVGSSPFKPEGQKAKDGGTSLSEDKDQTPRMPSTASAMRQSLTKRGSWRAGDAVSSPGTGTGVAQLPQGKTAVSALKLHNTPRAVLDAAELQSDVMTTTPRGRQLQHRTLGVGPLEYSPSLGPADQSSPAALLPGYSLLVPPPMPPAFLMSPGGGGGGGEGGAGAGGAGGAGAGSGGIRPAEEDGGAAPQQNLPDNKASLPPKREPLPSNRYSGNEDSGLETDHSGQGGWRVVPGDAIGAAAALGDGPGRVPSAEAPAAPPPRQGGEKGVPQDRGALGDSAAEADAPHAPVVPHRRKGRPPKPSGGDDAGARTPALPVISSQMDDHLVEGLGNLSSPGEMRSSGDEVRNSGSEMKSSGFFEMLEAAGRPGAFNPRLAGSAAQHTYRPLTPRSEMRKRMSGGGGGGSRHRRTTPSPRPEAASPANFHNGAAPSPTPTSSVQIRRSATPLAPPSPHDTRSESGEDPGPAIKQHINEDTGGMPVVSTAMSDWMKPTPSSSRSSAAPSPAGQKDFKRSPWVASAAGGGTRSSVPDDKRHVKTMSGSNKGVTAMKGQAGWRRQLELAAVKSRQPSRDPSPMRDHADEGASMSEWMDPIAGANFTNNMSDWMSPPTARSAHTRAPSPGLSLGPINLEFPSGVFPNPLPAQNNRVCEVGTV